MSQPSSNNSKQSEGETQSIEWRSGFFDNEDTIQLGLLSIRFYFNPITFSYVCYSKMDNKCSDQATDSFVSIAAVEVPEVFEILTTLLKELDVTPLERLPESLQKSTNNTDFTLASYWEENGPLAT